VTVAALEGVERVDVVAICKGRGFSGAMRRHNFSGQRATHGVKKCHRAIGGTSGSAFPSRVFKGKKMAGQYGNARTTMRNQKLQRIDAEQNLLLICGAVPGPNGGYVVIKKTNKL
jgi:large subunit ribosomal protein L3